MKQFLIIIMIFFIKLTFVTAQVKTEKIETQKQALKNQFRFSIGLGYEDGLILLKRNAIPALGMSYERRLSKHFGIASHLLVYYRSFSNNYVTSSGFPIFTKYRGSLSPLMTQMDKDRLANSGIFQLLSEEDINLLSIPIDLGITLYPVSTRHHKLGIYAGLGMTYESHNWYQDYLPGILTLTDGKKVDMTLNIPTEYRNFSPGFSTKIMYDYSFKNYAVGLRWGNSNVISIWGDAFGSGVNEPVWETSIYWSFKF